MSNFPDIIYRAYEPSQLDQAPLGTICAVEDGNYYIQVSSHDEPDWQMCLSLEHARNCRDSLINHDKASLS